MSRDGSEVDLPFTVHKFKPCFFLQVLDCEEKLLRTLCHEMCHAAAWLVDHVGKPPHGPVFRRWVRAASLSANFRLDSYPLSLLMGLKTLARAIMICQPLYALSGRLVSRIF